MVGGVVRSMEVSRSGLPAARLREPRSGSEEGRAARGGAPPRARGVLPSRGGGQTCEAICPIWTRRSQISTRSECSIYMTTHTLRTDSFGSIR